MILFKYKQYNYNSITDNVINALTIQSKFQVGQFCKEKNLRLHCDGARLFNAAAQLGVSAYSLVEPCDSVSICLSKGLGAPVGSVVVGNKDFIARFDEFNIDVEEGRIHQYFSFTKIKSIHIS